MKKRFLTSVVGVVAGTASLAAYYRSNASADAPGDVTSAAARGDVVDTVEATGTLEAVTTAQVGSQVSGTIQSLHADFNSQVRKGDVIARRLVRLAGAGGPRRRDRGSARSRCRPRMRQRG